MELTFTTGERLPTNLSERGARGGKWQSAYQRMIDTKKDIWVKIGGFGGDKKEIRRLQSAFNLSPTKNKTVGNTAYHRHMISNGFKMQTRTQRDDNGNYFLWVRKVQR